jgi:hypothetical protein
MRFEFGGQSASDPDNTYANTARLLNCYREFTGDGEVVVKSAPGVEAFSQPVGVFSRATARVDGMIYTAHGGTLYSVSSDGAAEPLGAVPNDATTSISGNNGNVTVVAGGRYFVWDGATLSEPNKDEDQAAFNAFADVTFFGQLTVLIEKDGDRVQWSDVANPKTLDGLSFATTEARDDKSLRALPIAGSLWIFKETSIERWQQSGADIRAIAGSTVDTGLKGRNLLTPTPTGCFFIGSDGKAYLVRGGSVAPVSTIAVETSLSKQEPMACVYYRDEGHEVCVITFDDRAAWCYDISTGEWHERPDFNVKTSVQAYGASFVTTDVNGIFKMSRNQRDFTGPLISRMVGRTIRNAGKWFTVSEFRTPCRVGRTSLDETNIEAAGLLANDGLLQTGETEGLDVATAIQDRLAATVTLRTSRDSAHRWSAPKARSLGFVGEYDQQVVWRSLGRFKQFTPELSWSEDSDFTVSAKVDLELT